MRLGEAAVRRRFLAQNPTRLCDSWGEAHWSSIRSRKNPVFNCDREGGAVMSYASRLNLANSVTSNIGSPTHFEHAEVIR